MMMSSCTLATGIVQSQVVVTGNADSWVAPLPDSSHYNSYKKKMGVATPIHSFTTSSGQQNPLFFSKDWLWTCISDLN